MFSFSSLLFRRLFFILTMLVSLSGLVWIKPRIEELRSAWKKKPQDLFYLPSPQMLQKISLGYRSLLADLIWIRGLLYVGAHFSKEEGGIEWLPQYFESIVGLDPKFERAYTWAAVLLVYNRKKPVPENVYRSIEILKRGREIFPEKHVFPYYIGTSYMFELSLADRSLEGLQKDHITFCKKPAPPKLEIIPLTKAVRVCLNRIGGQYLMEAASKSDSPDYMGEVASGTLSRSGTDNLIICQYLQELLWSADKDEVRENLKNKMKRHCGMQVSQRAFCLERLFTARWKNEFHYLPRRLYGALSLSPPMTQATPFVPRLTPEPDPCPSSEK